MGGKISTCTSGSCAGVRFGTFGAGGTDLGKLNIGMGFSLIGGTR